MRPLIIAGFMGGTLDAVGFAYGNYIWCIIGFFIGFYLAGTVYRFGENLHHKDKETIYILAGVYITFNVSYVIYICSTTATDNLYDRWGYINAATSYNANQEFIIKLILTLLLICISLAGTFKLK